MSEKPSAQPGYGDVVQYLSYMCSNFLRLDLGVCGETGKRSTPHVCGGVIYVMEQENRGRTDCCEISTQPRLSTGSRKVEGVTPSSTRESGLIMYCSPFLSFLLFFFSSFLLFFFSSFLLFFFSSFLLFSVFSVFFLFFLFFSSTTPSPLSHSARQLPYPRSQ
jgi:positive regulator of sigma E activity